jgi:hypothetical protein
MNIVEKAVQLLKSGKSIAISCYSGRGRTGTLMAIILGFLFFFKTVFYYYLNLFIIIYGIYYYYYFFQQDN